MTIFRKTTAFFAVLVGCVQAVNAHEMSEEENIPFSHPDIPAEVLPAASPGIGAAQSVVDQYKIWEAGQTLKFCFMSGSDNAKEFFADVSRLWENETSLTFDFGSTGQLYKCSNGGDFHIRVSLRQGGGNWSYVGTDSIRVSQSEPSLNISVSEPFSLVPKRRLGGTILHELGHALGLHHEHQSPESRCEEELAWEVVYSELSMPPNSWDRPKIDHNMRRLVASQRLRTSSYDRESIMHYQLPSRWFLNGEASSCYTTRKNTLSEQDVEAARQTYPASPQAQDRYFTVLDAQTAKYLTETNLSADQIEEIEVLINEQIGRIPGRDIQTDFPSIINNINTTEGDCSPIVTDTGNVTITCN